MLKSVKNFKKCKRRVKKLEILNLIFKKLEDFVKYFRKIMITGSEAPATSEDDGSVENSFLLFAIVEIGDWVSKDSNSVDIELGAVASSNSWKKRGKKSDRD